MSVYRVKLTDYAIEQLGETARYISKVLCAPETALKWSNRIQSKIAKLNQYPNRIPLTEEEPWHSEGIHKMPVENFLVYFWISENESVVWVTAVIYGQRDQIAALQHMPMA